MPPTPELDATVMDGLQQVIQDKHEALVAEKIAKREVACLKKQLEASEERMGMLEKKVVSSNSFNKRYTVYKEEAEKVLKKDKAEDIRQKARAEAFEYQKAFVSKFEEGQEEYQNQQDALSTKFKEESASIKKKMISTVTANGVQLPTLAGKGKKSGKKDPDKPKRSVIPSAYSRFVGDKKPGGVKEMHDKGLADGSITEKNLFAYAGTVWKDMTEEQKKPYVDAQKADKAAKDAAKAAANGGSVSGKRKKADSDDDEVNGAAAGGSHDDDDDDAPPPKKPAKSSKGASSSKSGTKQSANGKGPKQTKLQIVTSKPAPKEDSGDEEEVQDGSDDDEKKGEESDEDEAPAAEDSENDED